MLSDVLVSLVSPLYPLSLSLSLSLSLLQPMGNNWGKWSTKFPPLCHSRSPLALVVGRVDWAGGIWPTSSARRGHRKATNGIEVGSNTPSPESIHIAACLSRERSLPRGSTSSSLETSGSREMQSVTLISFGSKKDRLIISSLSFPPWLDQPSTQIGLRSR